MRDSGCCRMDGWRRLESGDPGGLDSDGYRHKVRTREVGCEVDGRLWGIAYSASLSAIFGADKLIAGNAH